MSGLGTLPPMIERPTFFIPSHKRFFVALTVALSLLVGGALTAAGPAEAKYKQPTCGKFTKKLKKAKGAKKKLAKLALKNCKNDRKVYNRVKDSRFVGVRSDGVEEDITLCANGIVADDVDSEFGQIFRGGWRIDISKVKGRYFEAGFAAKIDGGERVGALKFDRSGWQVGIFSLDTLYEFGPAERTDARELCATL